jgi:hypothetical protein
LAAGRTLYAMLKKPRIITNRIMNDVNCFFMFKHPL